MPHYNSPVKDWTVRLPKSLGYGKRKFGTATLQQGVMQFSRKKKNGCKLFSTRRIKLSIEERFRQENSYILNCATAFPPLKLK